jgi:hypothetical protein
MRFVLALIIYISVLVKSTPCEDVCQINVPNKSIGEIRELLHDSFLAQLILYHCFRQDIHA